jgi:hypothetical protein
MLQNLGFRNADSKQQIFLSETLRLSCCTFAGSYLQCVWAVARLQEGIRSAFWLLQSCRKLSAVRLDCCTFARAHPQRFLFVADLRLLIRSDFKVKTISFRNVAFEV